MRAEVRLNFYAHSSGFYEFFTSAAIRFGIPHEFEKALLAASATRMGQSVRNCSAMRTSIERSAWRVRVRMIDSNLAIRASNTGPSGSD